MSEGGENIPSSIEPMVSQKMVGTSIQEMRIKGHLFKHTMKGEWEKVVGIYRNHREAHLFKITRTGETALHLAVSENERQVVKELIDLIVAPQNEKAALKIQNNKGNTPLHFAATQGSVPMCKLIAGADSSLVGVSNRRGETPYFAAAAYGKKEAFLCLHGICGINLRYTRRSDGDNILHITIARDHFDLAFQIIHLYGEIPIEGINKEEEMSALYQLVNGINQEGMLPLHQLASNPSAFRSCYQMGRLATIIYNCTFVDRLKEEGFDQQSNQNNEENANNQKSLNYPQIYGTCMEFFHYLDKLLETVFCFKCQKQSDEEDPGVARYQGSERHPPRLGFTKRVMEFYGIGSIALAKMRNAKKKHTWALRVMKELLERTSMYEDDVGAGRFPPPGAACAEYETKPYHVNGGHVKIAYENIDQRGGEDIKIAYENIDQHGHGEDKGQDTKKLKKLHGETPLLLAAKYGIIEIVEEILKKFPVAKYDRNEERKNIILLATENRQSHIYELLLEKYKHIDILFQKVDKDGNSALHLAAKLGVYKPWQIAGTALQLQWEFKWYEFVRESIPPQFHLPDNNDGDTPKDVFGKSHEKLIKAGAEWLTKTSESCSVVAALVAGVTFATSSSVPGDFNDKGGAPKLGDKPAFGVFAISSVIALCFSVMALILFLAILTSRHEKKDFGKKSPRRLLIGLTSLFISIASMLVSFCAGHIFVLNHKLKFAAIPVYAVTCLTATIFAVVEFPLYLDIMFATFRKIPERSHQVV